MTQGLKVVHDKGFDVVRATRDQSVLIFLLWGGQKEEPL